MTFQGGIYVFQVFDFYAASGMVLLSICFFECICVAWFYGANKFNKDIEMMVGYPLISWFKYCWLYLTPILTLVSASIRSMLLRITLLT